VEKGQERIQFGVHFYGDEENKK
jgi:hypothetical protein